MLLILLLLLVLIANHVGYNTSSEGTDDCTKGTATELVAGEATGSGTE